MDQATVNQLLELNQQFYEHVAEPFAQSRHQPWPGWEMLFSRHFFTPGSPQAFRILDLGCGNGRFLSFLTSVIKANRVEYVGVDQSSHLLQLAQALDTPPAIQATFAQRDVMTNLPTLTDLKTDQAFDLTVLFGLLHHIPSYQLRHTFFSRLHTMLKPKGKVVFTTWQFLDNDRLKEKIIDPQSIDIDPQQLEQNDFILDWQRGVTAYRYCHYYTEVEVEALLLETGWQLESSFLADGHDHQTNRYYSIVRP